MRSLRQRFLFCLLAAFILVGAGCVQQLHGPGHGDRHSTAGNTVFTGDWRSFYERGRSLAGAGLHDEAVADFRRAIEGREKDQWRIGTAEGLVIDYFPHRELGIIYFRRGEYDKAIAELELSIENASSARACYFLNRARTARIDRYDLDQAAPGLNLESTTAGEITGRMTKIVRGVASDDSFVASMTVGDRQTDLQPAVRRKIFATEVKLHEGENRIRVAATDLAGKSTEKYLTVFCDRQGPRIEIEQLAIVSGLVHLEGNVSDDTGLVSLHINHERWPITGHAAGYNFKLTLPDEKITITATDRVGNATRAVVWESDPGLEEYGSTSHGGTPASHPAPAGSPGSDADPPYIGIRGPLPEEETYADTVLLEGMVSDASLLIYISINGTPVPNRNGKTVYFSQLKQLAPGFNTFHIVAADERGNKAGKTIRVHRRIPAVRLIESRMGVAVLALDQSNAPSRSGPMVRDRIIDSFRRQGRFRLVEKSTVDAVLREPAWNSALPIDSGKAADIGKKVAAQAVLTGAVIETPGSVEISGRLIDVATGSVLAGNDVFSADREPASLESLADELALKFTRDVPLVEGSLREIREGEVIIDTGTEKNVKPAMQLVTYREGPPVRHPVTGRLIVAEPQIIAILTVEEVGSDFCRASVLEQYAELLISDRIIAR